MSLPVIKILGMGDARTRLLREHLAGALALYPLKSQVVNVSEPNQILQAGVSSTPALLLDGKVVAEGAVPSTEDIVRMLKRRYLYRSKLYNLHNMLIPVDHSPVSDNAFRYACRLADHLEAAIEVVHVQEKAALNGNPQQRHARHQEELFEYASSLANTERNTFQPEHRLKLRATVTYGLPQTELVKASEQAGLIVMGTTGKGGLLKRFLGGVSAEVSREAHCPVLFVPPNCQYKGIKNILYAADYASLDTQKIMQLVSFAERFGAQIHFVHIGNTPAEPLRERLFAICYKHAEPVRPAFHFQHLPGEDVIGALNEYALQHEIDLAAFVTEHREGWQQLLHHSTTRRMLRQAQVPVLVAHLNNDLVY